MVGLGCSALVSSDDRRPNTGGASVGLLPVRFGPERDDNGRQGLRVGTGVLLKPQALSRVRGSRCRRPRSGTASSSSRSGCATRVSVFPRGDLRVVLAAMWRDGVLASKVPQIVNAAASASRYKSLTGCAS